MRLFCQLALTAAAAALLVPRAGADDFQGSTHKVPYDEEEVIDYSRQPANGPIEKLQAKLFEQSSLDPLTGALNRREMESVLRDAIERKGRNCFAHKN